MSYDQGGNFGRDGFNNSINPNGLTPEEERLVNAYRAMQGQNQQQQQQSFMPTNYPQGSLPANPPVPYQQQYQSYQQGPAPMNPPPYQQQTPTELPAPGRPGWTINSATGEWKCVDPARAAKFKAFQEQKAARAAAELGRQQTLQNQPNQPNQQTQQKPAPTPVVRNQGAGPTINTGVETTGITSGMANMTMGARPLPSSIIFGNPTPPQQPTQNQSLPQQYNQVVSSRAPPSSEESTASTNVPRVEPLATQNNHNRIWLREVPAEYRGQYATVLEFKLGNFRAYVNALNNLNNQNNLRMTGAESQRSPEPNTSPHQINNDELTQASPRSAERWAEYADDSGW